MVRIGFADRFVQLTSTFDVTDVASMMRIHRLEIGKIGFRLNNGLAGHRVGELKLLINTLLHIVEFYDASILALSRTL
jgi:hypothetical protein